MGRNFDEVKLKNILYKGMRFMMNSSNDRHVGRQAGCDIFGESLGAEDPDSQRGASKFRDPADHAR